MSTLPCACKAIYNRPLLGGFGIFGLSTVYILSYTLLSNPNVLYLICTKVSTLTTHADYKLSNKLS